MLLPLLVLLLFLKDCSLHMFRNINIVWGLSGFHSHLSSLLPAGPDVLGVRVVMEPTYVNATWEAVQSANGLLLSHNSPLLFHWPKCTCFQLASPLTFLFSAAQSPSPPVLHSPNTTHCAPLNTWTHILTQTFWQHSLYLLSSTETRLFTDNNTELSSLQRSWWCHLFFFSLKPPLVPSFRYLRD